MLFMAADNGVVSCLRCTERATLLDGKGRGFLLSFFTLANGRIYLCDESGKTFIFKAQKEYSLIATNDLGGKNARISHNL